ncbi:unnamed protein product [Lepeophtheirus salmonis]|uniref:(salmon louse) hypothetical protein n=1 Tax=Lepeophtheirus salmonis TaxID=72036 RepID=A0A7R8D0I0_LEPSM|nr:unnamed protein product [Lepeophtheirus salmonis]CAF2984222.1 unnamed protein product [Lepeophtheirus salmonis]
MAALSLIEFKDYNLKSWVERRSCNQHFYEGMKELKVLWLEKKASKENEWVSPLLWTERIQTTVLKFAKELGEIPEQDEDTKSPIKPKPSKNKKQSNKKSTIKNKVSSKVKRVKVKIDKTNPNWRLKPRDYVTVYDSDPFFESSSMDFPFISTTHHSRLIIRSIFLKDKKLLKSLINDNEKVSSLTIRRSLANDMFLKEASNKSRAPSPIQMIETTSTGIYNYRSLGIKNIRQIEASRGGREGNNALTKDDTKIKIRLNHKRSLIHYAAACTKGIDALKYLFSKSVSLEVPDKEGYTPLIIASNIENVEAMEFIILNLSKDSEFDSKVGIGGVDRALKNSWCPIHLAAVDSKFKPLKVLLKHKARVDKPLNTKYGKLTALMLASGMGNLEMVKFLVEHGQAKVEALDKFKRSALTHAGADPDRKDSSGNSNLHYACAYGWYHCAVVLLETGAVPDPVNEWKISPTAIAFLRGHRGLGEYMLQIPGVCTNFQDDKGRTLLMELLRVSPDTCNDEIIRMCFHFLAEYLDAKVRYVNDLDETSTRNVLRIFDFLLEKGRFVVTIWLSFKNYIAKGANIFAVHEELNPMVYEEDRKDAQGLCCRDPLVETIISGNMEMFNTLLKAAVDKVINDRNNTDRMGILEQILALCKLQNDTTVDGFNALHLSINNSTDDFNINLEIESLLFKCGVNPVLQDSFGRIPLHYAFIKNYFKKSVRSEYKFIPEVPTVCCMLLVDHNADINRIDRFGNTPLAYAIIGNHEATTITLLQKGANSKKMSINPMHLSFFHHTLRNLQNHNFQ